MDDMPEGAFDTDALRRDYEVRYFLAPFVAVIRKSDGAKGFLRFNHRPRYYYAFEEDN